MSILSLGSIDDITVTHLQQLVDFGAQNVNDSNVDLAVAYGNATITSGSDDDAMFTINGSTMGDAVVVTGGAGNNNGLESATVVSDAGSQNIMTAFRHVQSPVDNDFTNNAAATSLTTMDFMGETPLEMNQIPNSVRTIDASEMSGNFQLGNGDGSAGDPYVAFHAANQDIVSLIGGSADDLFVFGGQFTDADMAINGGEGMDTLQASLGGAVNIVGFSNIEKLILNATAPAQLNLTGIFGIHSITIDADGATHGLTLLNAGGNPLPGMSFRGTGAQAAQTYDAVTYTAAAGAGTALNVTVGNRGTALNATGVTNQHMLGALTVPGVTALTLGVTEGPATIATGITGTSLTSVTATASSNLTLNAIATGGADTIQVFNASAVTGNMTATLNDTANGTSITGAAGNDTITVADSAAMASSVVTLGNGDDTFVSQDTNSADVVNSGAGTDTITGGGGVDTINPGDGNDTIIMTSVFAAAPTDIDANDTISGFAVGDRIMYQANATLDNTPTNNNACTDQEVDIATVGADTIIRVDLDTDAAQTACVTTTLTAVMLTNANFTYDPATELLTRAN
jgi:hypothetical protein